MSNVWAAVPYVQLSHMFVNCIDNRQNQLFSEMSLRDVMELPIYNTRTRNKLHIPKTNHDFAQNNLRYRIIQTINTLPDNVIRKM